MMNCFKADKFYNFIVILLILGVFATIRPIMFIALGLWLVYCFLAKDWPNIKELWQEDIVKKTCFFAGLYFGFLLLDNLLLMDKAGFKETLHYLERALPGIICLLMLYKREDKLKYALYGMAIGIMFISATGIYGRLVLQEGRVNSYLGNPNNLGGWIVVTLPFFVALAYKLRKNIFCAGLGIMAIMMQLTSLYLSNSRGSLVAVIATVAAGCFLYMPRKVKVAIVTVIMLAATSALGLGVHNSFLAIADNGQVNMIVHGKSDMERVYLLQSGVNMFMDHKLLGVGKTNYGKEYVNKYMHSLATNKALSSPHNMVLHYLDYYGILGSLGLIALAIALFKKQLNWLYDDFKYDCVVLGMFLTSVGFFVHGQLDCLHLTNFVMQIMWFLWAFTCCYVINSKYKGSNKFEQL